MGAWLLLGQRFNSVWRKVIGRKHSKSATGDGSISFKLPEMKKRFSLDKADTCKSFYSSNTASLEEYYPLTCDVV
jgi:hypothetical protein